jgi:2-hydroxy-3-keto-5-methylthiopentenyl-1-phosphate phosphatase
VQGMVRQPSWASGWAISCDFDGTITRGDAVLGLLRTFAEPAWRQIEADWEAGRIDARTCLRDQTRLVRVEPQQLAAWVDAHPIDPEAAGFFADCVELGLDVCVISDGYDWVIRRVMARLGFPGVPVFANHLLVQDEGRWTLEFPFARAGCGSGACKCALITGGRPRLHIGDGRSDVCVSNACELVFAKDSLLAHRQAHGLPSLPFSDFGQIRSALRRAEPPRPVPALARVSA